MGEDTRAIEQQIEATRESMGDTVAALSHKADVPGRMKESMSDKKQAVTDKLSSAKESVTGSAGGAASSAQDGSHKAVGMAQNNPIGLTVGAAAVGFVVGSLLPATRIEEERIGPVADPGARAGQRRGVGGSRARQAGGAGCGRGGKRRGQGVRSAARRAAARLGAGNDSLLSHGAVVVDHEAEA